MQTHFHISHASSPTREAPALKVARARLGFIGLMFGLFFLAIAGRTLELAVVGAAHRGDALAASDGEDAPQVPFLALLSRDGKALDALAKALEGEAGARDVILPRATITDRNGVTLATSLEAASLYADARAIRDPRGLARRLARILPGVNEQATLERLRSGKRFVWIKRNLTPREQRLVNELGAPGLNFQDEYARVYPHKELLSHALGFVGVDNRGLAGVEKYFDARLRQDGQNKPLALSIDVRLQHIVRKQLAGAMKDFQAIGATGVVVHIPTGEILALANLPDFDPHHPASGAPEGLFNRASLGAYEMGSTFKTFTMAMALDGGVAAMGDSYDASRPLRVGGYAISDYHAKNRWLSLPEIFVYSSNIGTARVAMEAGTEMQRAFLGKLGMLDAVEIELPERAAPLLPAQWKDLSTMTISYGHGISVSPLHLAQGVATVAGGGRRERLTLVRDGNDGRPRGERIVSEETSRKVRRLLRMVVQYGTGKNGEVRGYRVGGKTGTAEKISGRGYSKNAQIASFVGVFPSEKPEYVVLVMVDEPKGNKSTYGYATGGWVAAPAASRIVAQMAPMLGLEPVYEEMGDDMDQFWAGLGEREKRRREGAFHAVAFQAR